MDMVPNHCSDQHPWFQAALARPPGSDERARFWFRDGSVGGEPPNNWPAVFGGSVWTPVGGDDPQWFLGTFTPYQPDFDHRHPAVAAMFADALHFWFDRGVDGFRVDAVWPVGKDPDLPDWSPTTPDEFNPYTRFRPEGHEVWRAWRRVVDDYAAEHPDRDVMLVAEAYTPRRPDLLAEYTRPDEFHQCFAFDLLLSPWHAGSMRRAVREAFEHVGVHGSWPTFVLNNHDTQRIVTRLGREGRDNSQGVDGFQPPLSGGTRQPAARDQAERERPPRCCWRCPVRCTCTRARSSACPRCSICSHEVRQDPVFARTDGALIGRDGCRVPMPWSAAAAGAHGFSLPDAAAEPWLPQPAGWGDYAAEVQETDETSMLTLYRRLLAARRDHLGTDDAELVDDHDDLVVLRRGVGRRCLQHGQAARHRRRGERSVADHHDRQASRRQRRPRRHDRVVRAAPPIASVAPWCSPASSRT